ncbi:nucleotide exchange factor GrpE [Olivibacter sp. SDN3]|uniref:nucleotide exchange factor GrpE n=1 Tax=Olivibacter sp. SDN3 TaxID=2764720 RepID=UPI0016515401|nr:nucleotide exchange factor GrpE [Olivibacter sp. SDN3]QNL48909.1 nucleotide exchange factor GrpE [Olivibacter sp. SDN3]
MEEQKKKENLEENQNLENKNIAEELESVNEARQHSKAGLDTVEDADEVDVEESPALSEEEKLQHELTEANNKYLRLYAEFDNYKRRTSKERVELLQSAGKEVIGDLLTVLDDFERARKAIENTQDVGPIKEGVDLVYQKLKSILTKKGLKEMNAVGEPFNADLHEAITKIPAPSEELAGKVIDEVEKGYFLNDKILRYAKVVVGSESI